MDFQDRFAQVLCSLFSVLRVSSSHTGDLLSEEMNYPKALPITEINPVSKFWLEPFESADDRFYNFTYYLNSVLNGEKIIEKINEFENKKQPMQIKTEAKTLRAILDAPWFVPNSVIRSDLSIPSVKEEICARSKKYSARLEQHPNTKATTLLEELHDLRRLKRNRPLDSITRFQT